MHEFKWIYNLKGRVYFYFKASEKQAKVVKKEWASLLNGDYTKMKVTDASVIYISFPVVEGGASKVQKQQRQDILNSIWKTIEGA